MSNVVSERRTRFQMRQRLIAIGEDYDIRDEQGQVVFHVDGKVFRIRDTFVITDEQHHEVVTVKKKLLAIRETMTLERDGDTIASVHKALWRLLRGKFIINFKNGDKLVATGGFLDHEYKIRRGRKVIAKVSKRWFAIRDTYGIEIDAGEDIGVILGIAVVIDEVIHEDDEKQDAKHDSESNHEHGDA